MAQDMVVQNEVDQALNNPTYCLKKDIDSATRKRPPKLSSRRKPTPHLEALNPAVSLMSAGVRSLSVLYDSTINIPYFDQCFELLEKIGEGSFGEVFKVKSIDNGQYYAVKILKYAGESDKRNKLDEVRNFEFLSQDNNIISLINAWEQDEYVYMQMELGVTSLEEYTLLYHFIREEPLWNVLLDMLLALKKLHDNNRVHLDIKLENIILCESGMCKLTDFGLLINLRDTARLKNATEGDSKYLAVELMNGKFTKAADVFSLGISMFELSSDMDLPSHGPMWHCLRRGRFPNKVIKRIPRNFYIFIRKMMCRDYKKRPSVNALLKMSPLKHMWRRRRGAQKYGVNVIGKRLRPPVRLNSPPVPWNAAPSTPPNNGYPLSQSSILSLTPNPSTSSSEAVVDTIPSPGNRKPRKRMLLRSAKKLDFTSDE